MYWAFLFPGVLPKNGAFECTLPFVKTHVQRQLHCALPMALQPEQRCA